MNSAASANTLRGRLSTALAARVTVDSRALAAFRVGLGCVLLLDLLLRSRNLRTFYTDGGVLPVAELAARSPLLARFSLHAQSGEAWWQALLFATTGTAAVALVVGYRTRLATVASLGLLLSLHARNPYVLSAGDALLQHLLAWALFLPLGGRWSVDARQHGPGRDRVASAATAGMLVQVVLFYAVNAILKTRSEAWTTGEATATVFGLDRFTTLLGPLLREAPLLLDIGHWVWFALLLFAPLLVVTTGRRRAVLVGAFAAMHLGMLLTLFLGVFPVVCLVALLPFLDSGVWDALGRTRVTRRFRPRLDGALDRLSGALPAWSPARPLAGGETPQRVGHAVAAVGLVGVVLFNAFALGFVPAPPPVDDAVSSERTDPRWSMFAPHPTGTDRWFVAPASRNAGGRVDALDGTAVEWEPPDHVANTYSSARTRKYMSNLRYDDRLQRSFADYLCDRWDRTRDTTLRTVSVYAVETTALGDSKGSWERRRLVSVVCTTARA